MDNNRRKELLNKFENGSLSQAEKMELWRMNEQGETEYADDRASELDMSEDVETTPEMEASLARYKKSFNGRIRYKKQIRTMYLVAASMAAIFLLYFGFSKFSTRLFFNDDASFVTIEAAQGEVKTLILPDSSIATLSPGTVLRYPEAYAKEERKIFLDKGEAFFEVVKDPQHPFRVVSGELQTTALGTSFTVQYDPFLKREKVNLYTGKVAVASVNEGTNLAPVKLTPGKAYEYVAGKVILSDFNHDYGNPIAKGLDFRDVPFEEALYRIGVWYGISILTDRKNTELENINGNFKDKKIEDIFFILSNTYDLKFTKTDSLTYKIMQSNR